MGTQEKITISLPEEMVSDLKDAVSAGEYASTSEAIRDALRQWRRSRTVIALNNDELRRLAVEGAESGEPVDGERVMNSLRRKYAALADDAER
jgi:antitoxin ParD1/3/4